MKPTVERFLPVTYMAVTLGLIAFLLPTALRPPEPPPPTSAEFSPDAPPNEEQQLTLSEMARGTTATAGAGQEMEAGPEEIAPLEPEVEEAAVRGTCFGDPPRASESIYAAPCVPAWTGDNGGATWDGVTGTEIRLAIPTGTSSDEGRVPRQESEGESDEQRTLRVWQEYLNEHYELYGRRLQLYYVSHGQATADDDAQQACERRRAAVQRADEEYEVFGIVNVDGTGQCTEDEALRRGLMHMGRGAQPLEHFQEEAPYAWSFVADADKHREWTAELICKQMGDDPPQFNEQEDPTFDYSEPRRYGIIAYNDLIHYGAIERYEELLAECGLEFEDGAKVYMNLSDQAEQMAGAVTRMRAEGVTTIILATDQISPAVFTEEAENSSYYPEWVHDGTSDVDANFWGGSYVQSQWRHAVGVTSTEIPGGRPSGEDGYRAYKQTDPDNEPEEDNELFLQLLHIAGGMQMAGPELTPHTFQEGMHEAWPSREPEPSWTIGGGYVVGDWTYPDYAALQWWDPDADRPDSNLPGAYRHPLEGERFKRGEIPEEPIPFLEEGIERPPEHERM